MTPFKILTPTVAVTILLLATSPAHADQRGGGRDRGGNEGRSGAEARGGGGASAAAQRGNPPVREYHVGARERVAVRVAPRVIVPRAYVAPRFYRPYYTFQPRISLGFGLWVGYPVAYPRYYAYPYGYPYASLGPYGYPYPARVPYGYPAPAYVYPAPIPSAGYPASTYPSAGYPAGTITPDPGRQAAPNSIGAQSTAPISSGGLSFEITPSTAAVFVDGTYVGTAADFGPTAQPLGLTPGRHHIELRAAGYRSTAFDADVTAGQVIPYEGTLQAQ